MNSTTYTQIMGQLDEILESTSLTMEQVIEQLKAIYTHPEFRGALEDDPHLLEIKKKISLVKREYDFPEVKLGEFEI